MKQVFYDTEIFQDFFLASFLIDGEFKDFSFHKELDEKTLNELRTFIVHLRKNKVQCVGYNSLKYDNQILEYVLGAQTKTIKDVRTLSDRIISGEDTFPNDLKLNCLDLGPFFKVGAVFRSLKETAADNGFESVLECPVSFDLAETSTEDIEEITRYCHNDVLITEALFKNDKVTDELSVRTLISENYNIPLKKVLQRSAGRLSDDVIKYMLGDDMNKKREAVLDFMVSDIVSPKIEYKTAVFKEAFEKIKQWHIKVEDKVAKDGSKKKNRHIEDSQGLSIRMGRAPLKIGLGGIHYNTEKPFIFKSGTDKIIDIDINGCYPILVKNLGLGPEGIEKEYSGIFSQLLSLRANAKTKGENQLFKLVLNAQTGKLNSEHSDFYSPKCNASITINGQLIVAELVESLHAAKFVMAQVNTDGLSTFVSEERSEEFYKLVSDWKKKWGFDLSEKKYKSFIQRDVNNYIAVAEDDSIKLKGFFKPGNLTQFPITIRATREYLLNNVPIKETIDSGSPLDFIRYHNLAKKYTWRIPEDLIGFNKKGVNRFYIAKVKNTIYGEYPPLKNKTNIRLITKAENVLSANILSDIDPTKIDKQAYIDDVMYNLKEYENVDDLSYNPSCHVEEEIKKKAERGSSENLRGKLNDLGLIDAHSNRLSECIKCGNRSGAAALYDNKVYCFSCRQLTTSEDIDRMVIEVAPNSAAEPEVAPSSTETPEADNHIPDIVWQGYVGDVAKALGKKDADALFIAFSSASSLIQRQIQVPHGGEVPILGSGYYLLLKKTGSGKSTALNQIKQILGDRVDYDSDVSSGQAIFNMIADPIVEGIGKAEKIKGYRAKPATLIVDEFKTLLNSMLIPNSSLGSALRALFIYVGAFTMNKIGNVKTDGKTRQKVMNPTMTLTAVTTERELFTSVTQNLKENGFLNRFLFFPGSDTQFDVIVKRKNHTNMNKLSSLNPIRTRINAYTDENLMTGDIYSDEINEYLSPYINHLYAEYKYKDNPEADVCGRLHVHLHRLVLMYGMMTGNDRPTLDNAKAALEVIKMCEKYTLDLFSREGENINASPWSKRKNDIEDIIIGYIKKHGKSPQFDVKRYVKRKGISEGEFEIALRDLSSKEDSTLQIIHEENGESQRLVKTIDFRK